MKLTKKEIKKFQRYIFAWWKKNKRDLPWRHTHDPYKILVSEVMLQQTQVSRVLPKYDEFLQAFPDVFSLAKASPAEILQAWKGMGYNRRALYLKKAAQMVVDVHRGMFPKEEQSLLKLPGLGIYTARALLVFAYKENVAMVDTNIRQIITHFFFNDIPQKEFLIDEVADQLLPTGKSWEWHQALMDYGALRRFAPQGKPSNKSRLKIPFRESNRFYRGKVMDKLREHEMKEFVLLKEFGDIYDKPEDFFLGILEGLAKDGLVVRENGKIQLPES